MVRTYGRLCFKDVEELSPELGGSLNGLLLGSCLAGTCGAFLRTQEKRPCGLNFVAGVKGPPAGLDVKARDLGPGWGGFSPSSRRRRVSTVRGYTAAWTSRCLPQLLDRNVGGWRKRISATNLTPQHCTGPEAKPKPPLSLHLGSGGCVDARHHRLERAHVCL